MNDNPLCLATLDSWRTKASEHASFDRIGIVIARSFDLMSTVARDGVGAESVSDQVALLAQDRAFVSSRDNSATTPLRELIYAMIESFGSLVDDIAKKRADEIAEIMGQAPAMATDQYDTYTDAGVHMGGLLDCGSSVLKEEPLIGASLSYTPMRSGSDGGGEAGVSSTSMNVVERVVEPRQEVPTSSKKMSTPQPLSRKRPHATDNDRQITRVEPPTASAKAPTTTAPTTTPKTTIPQMSSSKTTTPSITASKTATTSSTPKRPERPKNPTPTASTLHLCSSCSKTFDTMADLIVHEATHTITPAQSDASASASASSQSGILHCSVCSKTFQYDSQLRTHMYSHTGEKPHKCDICSASFTLPSLLKHHQRNVHKILPYECKKCGWKFEMKSELTNHIRTTIH